MSGRWRGQDGSAKRQRPRLLQVVLVALLGALSVAACADDLPSATTLSGNCRDLLQQSERAALEWQLEQDFGTFERGISGLAAAT